MESENFFEKCRTCQYCFTKNDDDYVYCRKRNGKCEYKPYKSRKKLRGRENKGMCGRYEKEIAEMFLKAFDDSEEKISCNCQHNSNSRDNESCCKCGRKKTNADRIRNMSDEELAKYIYDVSEHCADCVVCGDDCDSCDGTEDICVPKIIEWLQSEAE